MPKLPDEMKVPDKKSIHRTRYVPWRGEEAEQAVGEKLQRRAGRLRKLCAWDKDISAHNRCAGEGGHGAGGGAEEWMSWTRPDQLGQ